VAEALLLLVLLVQAHNLGQVALELHLHFRVLVLLMLVVGVGVVLLGQQQLEV